MEQTRNHVGQAGAMLETLEASARETGMLAAEAAIAAAASGEAGPAFTRAAAELLELSAEVLHFTSGARTVSAAASTNEARGKSMAHGLSENASGARQVQQTLAELLAKCTMQIARCAPQFAPQSAPQFPAPTARWTALQANETARNEAGLNQAGTREENLATARDTDRTSC